MSDETFFIEQDIEKLGRKIASANSRLTDIVQWVGKNGEALGDSITYGVNSPAETLGTSNAGYVKVVKDMLQLATYNNRGVAGRPMANGSANGAGTNTAGKLVTYTNVDLVTILSGTNDFKLNIALGTQGVIGDTTFDNTKFYGAYRELIEYILVQKPTAKIVLITPIQRDQAGYDVNYTNPAGFKLIDYVNATKNIGQMYGLPVYDAYSNSGITKLTLTTFTSDGLHPSYPVGYARLGSVVGRFLRTV